MQSRILIGPRGFATEFERCCKSYDSLSFAVAWCGDPARVMPYRYIEQFSGKVTATVGVAFSETHPDAFSWLLSLGADLRVYDDARGMFHPKVYLFRNGAEYAAFVGSSNLTHAGFFSNVELNTLIEGQAQDLRDLIAAMKDWHSAPSSFVPTPQWLAAYRLAYDAKQKAARAARVPTAAEDDQATAGSWLATARWLNCSPILFS